MADRIYAVGWDADRVLYRGLITSICAEQSVLDPGRYFDGFVDKGWFTHDDAKRWADEYNEGREIEAVGDLARMLTDFLYSMRKGDDSVITKKQTIEGKQLILGGLTMRDIRRISDSVEYSNGAEYAVSALSREGVHQTLFSDGLGPHITHQVSRLGMKKGKGVPPVIRLPDGSDVEYRDEHLEIDDAQLTGRVVPFDKAAEFFDYLAGRKYDMRNVAVIDDSGSNVKGLLRPVLEKGGIAIGYMPTDAHRPMFNEAGIPILKGDDLQGFYDIVMDPRESVIARNCE